MIVNSIRFPHYKLGIIDKPLRYIIYEWSFSNSLEYKMINKNNNAAENDPKDK